VVATTAHKGQPGVWCGRRSQARVEWLREDAGRMDSGDLSSIDLAVETTGAPLQTALLKLTRRLLA
jgi:hypothetical protein